eukprot:TRINITY_DN25480_c0_g1_i1.p1 TRINITY_DN25480_c0_g1~~TRINITY_DN25480_c0_g1_i1.p1  ORF type:complete len:432 (+),score=109.33 TRINITY_DN25480_c0_g1_i1:116-1411(+)
MHEVEQPGFLDKEHKRHLEAFSARLLKEQRGPDLGEEERCLTHFIRWLMPRWADFESIFAHDGTVAFDGFEDFVRFEERYGSDARKVFDYLAESDGIVRYRTFLALRRAFSSTLDKKRVGLTGLKKLMIARFGSLGRAWRMVFDKEDKGRVCLAEFVKACREAGFQGDVKSAWMELSDGSMERHITLKDWDPEVDMLLRTFCKVLVQRHGQLREGWYSILKHGFGGNAGMLTSQEFVDIVTGLGFTMRHARIVLAAVDADRSHTVTQDEFMFVQHYGEGLEPPKEPGPQRDSARPPRRDELDQMDQARESKIKKSAEMRTPTELNPNPWSVDKLRPQRSESPPVESSPVSQTTNPEKGSANEFVVLMTKDEYSEYLRRRRKKSLAQPQIGSGNYSPQDSPKHASNTPQKVKRDSSSPSQPVIVTEMPFHFL